MVFICLISLIVAFLNKVEPSLPPISITMCKRKLRENNISYTYTHRYTHTGRLHYLFLFIHAKNQVEDDDDHDDYDIIYIFTSIFYLFISTCSNHLPINREYLDQN